jgi:hypothetical protein
MPSPQPTGWVLGVLPPDLGTQYPGRYRYRRLNCKHKEPQYLEAPLISLSLSFLFLLLLISPFPSIYLRYISLFMKSLLCSYYFFLPLQVVNNEESKRKKWGIAVLCTQKRPVLERREIVANMRGWACVPMQADSARPDSSSPGNRDNSVRMSPKYNSHSSTYL